MPDLLPQSFLQECLSHCTCCPNSSNRHSHVGDVHDKEAGDEEIDEPQDETIDIVAEFLCGLLTAGSRDEACEFGCELAEYNCHQWEGSTGGDRADEGGCV